MRILSTVGLVCLTVAPATWCPAVAQDTNVKRHNWDHIAYPTLPALPDGFQAPTLALYKRDAGLQFSLSYYVPATKEPRNEPPSAEKITVRLHSADGKIAEPEPDENRGAFGIGDHRGHLCGYDYRFPWKRNVLEEAWIELRLPGQAYWVEIPYGFTRNPGDRLTPAVARRGKPAFTATMKPAKKDRLVPWLFVNYDLGSIQNGWALSVNLANPLDTEAEIVLFRNDSEIGKSMYLWELHSPRTTIGIKQPAGWMLESRGMSIRLHEDGLRRSDSFKFNRNPGQDERCWGTVSIKVDDKSYECVVPSSLFKYLHGVADPYNKALLPRGSDSGR
jgi:hypothetical protein